MAKSRNGGDEKRDETPTRVTHINGASVVVPAYKVDGLVGAGLFSKSKTSK